ncbi:hypothetical protein T265_14040, partial [Opisthorchis viverrini]
MHLHFPAKHRCLAVRLLSQRLWLRTLIVLLSRCGRPGSIPALVQPCPTQLTIFSCHIGHRVVPSAGSPYLLHTESRQCSLQDPYSTEPGHYDNVTTSGRVEGLHRPYLYPEASTATPPPGTVTNNGRHPASCRIKMGASTSLFSGYRFRIGQSWARASRRHHRTSYSGDNSEKNVRLKHLSVPNCRATRRKHEDWATTRLPKPSQGKSRGKGRVRTTDLA